MRDANSTSTRDLGAFADARQRFCSRNPAVPQVPRLTQPRRNAGRRYRVIRANSLRVSQIS